MTEQIQAMEAPCLEMEAQPLKPVTKLASVAINDETEEDMEPPTFKGEEEQLLKPVTQSQSTKEEPASSKKRSLSSDETAEPQKRPRLSAIVASAALMLPVALCSFAKGFLKAEPEVKAAEPEVKVADPEVETEVNVEPKQEEPEEPKEEETKDAPKEDELTVETKTETSDQGTEEDKDPKETANVETKPTEVAAPKTEDQPKESTKEEVESGPFSGIFVHTESENLESFLVELGIGWIMRKVALNTNPTTEVQQKGNDFVVRFQTGPMSRMSTFTIGQEYEEKSISGDLCMVKPRIEDGKLIQYYEPKEGSKAKPLQITREIDGDILTQTMEAGNMKCIRKFKRKS